MIERGHSPEWLLGLDMLAFSALVASSDRVNAAKTLQGTWLNQAAAQGNGKDLKKVMAPFEKRAVAGLRSNEGDFQKKFKGGF